MSEEKHLRFAHLPTPIERLDNLSLDFGRGLYIKRDDYTGSELSGNKVRKLEYVLTDAVNLGCDCVITCGSLQSNHCRATAAACARLGLACHLVLRGEPGEAEGNLFLDLLLGAHVHPVPEGAGFEPAMQSLAESLRREGKKPCLIPLGASNALGAKGYLDAYREITDYERERGIRFDAVCLAVGSGGTYAGLWLGNKRAGLARDIVGFAVSNDSAHFVSRVGEILREMGEDKAEMRSILILDSYVGLGYGKASREEMKTYLHIAKRQGLVLDPCYTGKAFLGMLNEIKQGCLKDKHNILFVHTGGLMGWTREHRALAMDVRREMEQDNG